MEFNLDFYKQKISEVRTIEVQAQEILKSTFLYQKINPIKMRDRYSELSRKIEKSFLNWDHSLSEKEYTKRLILINNRLSPMILKANFFASSLQTILSHEFNSDCLDGQIINKQMTIISSLYSILDALHWFWYVVYFQKKGPSFGKEEKKRSFLTFEKWLCDDNQLSIELIDKIGIFRNNLMHMENIKGEKNLSETTSLYIAYMEPFNNEKLNFRQVKMINRDFYNLSSYFEDQNEVVLDTYQALEEILSLIYRKWSFFDLTK